MCYNYYMKNYIIWFIVLLVFIVTMYFLNNKEIVVTVFKTDNDLVFEYNEDIYVKDIVVLENAKIKNESLMLDTSSIGNKKIKVEYYNDYEIYNYIINYVVTDTVAPLIMGSTTHTIIKGSTTNLVNTMLCGDNYDKEPNCYLDGDYDINKIGTYYLKYIAIDSSNNKSEKDYTLVVKNSISKSYSSDPKSTSFNEYIDKYKTDKTMIGIDVSSWQGDIDWEKVKNNGVEFAIIRIGFGYNKNGELVYDSKFKDNLRNAKNANIPVGLYFYSYAKSTKESIEQAKWIVESLDGETLELPIAFDWEDWSNFNNYKMSFTDLNNAATEFFKELNKSNYKGMIYGSYSYLEKIWNIDNYKTWLAHYSSSTDYPNNYYIWQLSNTGNVDGINGYVDINVLYKN